MCRAEMLTKKSLTNRSGAIASGGTAQQLAPVNTSRGYLLIENISAGDLWVDFGTPAVADQPSVKIPSSGALVFEAGFIPSQAVSIIGATTGQKFVAKEG